MKGWHRNEAKQFFPSKDEMASFVGEIAQGELLSEGAEGKVWKNLYMTKASVVKERMRKTYRVPELDAKLNKTRLLQEARCIAKCKKVGVPVPDIYMVDTANFKLHMEFIEGQTLKNKLWAEAESNDGSYQACLGLAELIGTALSKMHESDLIHGDLTSSNILVRPDILEIVLVDFGLGSVSCTNIEDKAVDLYVLEKALLATHPGSEEFTEAIMEAYARQNPEKAPAVLNRLEAVRQRGRKREMVG